VRLRSATLFLVPAEAGPARLGLTVTRRIGNAVVRNRLKRRFREIFRRNRDMFRKNLLIVVNVAPPAATMPFREMEREFLGAFTKAAAK
jgi:ribonuclease P protein component